MITGGTLCCALILVYQFLPETLGKEIPPHPMESLYSSVLSTTNEKDVFTNSSSSFTEDISNRAPLTDDLDHGWIYPLHVLRDVFLFYFFIFIFFHSFYSFYYFYVIFN